MSARIQRTVVYHRLNLSRLVKSYDFLSGKVLTHQFMMESSLPVVLEVAVVCPLRQSFDYLLPPGLLAESLAKGELLKPGMRLEVPFGKKGTRLGILLQVKAASALPPDQLKEIIQILDPIPLFDTQHMAFMQQASQYYQAPLGELMGMALPKLLRSLTPNQALCYQLQRTEVAAAQVTSPQQKILTTLIENAKQKRISWAHDFPKKSVDILIEKNLITALPSSRGLTAGSSDLSASENSWTPRSSREMTERALAESSSLSKTIDPAALLKSSPHSLNAEQLAAFLAISQKIKAADLNAEQTEAAQLPIGAMTEKEGELLQKKLVGHAQTSSFAPFLLQGVTGSGKTEIYLQAIAQVLQQQRSALVLIPEISLTPQTRQRFEDRFNIPIYCLHSGLSDQERLTVWQKVLTQQVAIVLGTRSALFTPLARLGIIIVDEEHDASFKQQEGIRYSARDLAVLRAHVENIPIILGSATPSLKSLYNAKNRGYIHLQLGQRATGASLPDIEICDIRKKHLREGLAPRTLELIAQHLDKKQQVLIFLNRRGYAPVITCHLCGWTAMCHLCDKAYTFHAKKRQLRCHWCDHTRAVPTLCESCRCDQLLPVGLGTERIEAILQEIFQERRIVRIDRDTTRGKKSLNKYLEGIIKGKYDILLGTQMLAKGHHFPKVTLVVVLDSDSGLISTDFSASERLGQLVTQVVGRAGREKEKGQVLIQTRQPHHPLLQCLVREGYTAFAETLLSEREATRLPPYGHLALIRARSAVPSQPNDFLRVVKNITAAGVTILGPIAAPMAKIKGEHRSQILLHATQRPVLQMFLPKLLDRLTKQKIPRQLHWSIDLDPIDLF